jgi:steroid delta-isomerase-like uncharacterized protein
MTATEQNKEIVRDYIGRLFTKGDLTAIDDYLAEDYVDHDPPFGTPGGRAGMRGAAAMFREAFPDWHAEVGHLIAEGDLVCERFIASGVQRGAVMGVPPTGNTVTLPGIQIFRISGGKIAERWGQLDELGLLRQLGLVSGP